MDMTFAQTQKTRVTSYVVLPYVHGSIINPQKDNDKYCAVWSILINLNLVKTTVHKKHYCFMKKFNTFVGRPNRNFLCRKNLTSFSTKNKLHHLQDFRLKNESPKMLYPKENSFNFDKIPYKISSTITFTANAYMIALFCLKSKQSQILKNFYDQKPDPFGLALLPKVEHLSEYNYNADFGKNWGKSSVNYSIEVDKT